MLQGEELEPIRGKAEQFGVKEIYIDDLREEFVRDYVFPMFRCYSAASLLGSTSFWVVRMFTCPRTRMHHINACSLCRPLPYSTYLCSIAYAQPCNLTFH